MQDLVATVFGLVPLLLADAAGDAENFELLVTLVIYGLIFALPVLGIITGRLIEAKHFRSLDLREGEYQDIMVTDLKTPATEGGWRESGLVNGSAVIATDYFKSLAASFRKLFGGEFKGLKKMQDRARREAILRMLVEARALGATAVCNVRIETATIGGKSRKRVAGVEVFAYGTALVPGVREGSAAAVPPALDPALAGG